jgi:tight adherence protein B
MRTTMLAPLGWLPVDGTGLLVGLLLGVGAFCLWWACWMPDPSRSRARGPASTRLRDALVQAGAESVSPRALVVTCLGVGVTAGLATAAVSRAVTIAVAFGLIAVWAPVAVVGMRARHRRTVLREVWPEVVDNLASGVRAGLSLPEALAQLADRGPAPLRAAFAAFGRDYRATGRFGEALDNLKAALADPVADRICEALRITREVGGSDLGRLLRSLSAFLREDARTRAELEARQSWTVNAARLAVAAPWLVLALLATRPESVRAYDTPRGAVVLTVGAALCVVAYWLMLRVARLPQERRVLR